MTEEFGEIDSPEVWIFTPRELEECPHCGSKNISKDGKSFIYSVAEKKNIPTRYCYDCRTEWMEDGYEISR